LALLDRKIQHFEAGALTTALYAMISPDRQSVRISSAGHLRPVIALPDKSAALVDLPVDAPLGVGRFRRRRRATTIELPAGALLLSYTDGLVERRHQIIDVGIKALIDVVTPDNPEAVCATVMSHLGTDQPLDDIAVLALRRQTAAGTPAPK
jgi:serine phosphatase RsbU (regulator of sigma subunit)